MTATVQSIRSATISQSPADANDDAFSSERLSGFAAHPAGASLFRAQHEQLHRLMQGILGLAEHSGDPERALQLRMKLTSLSVLAPMHQELEDTMLHKSLGGEPRMRMLAEQSGREMVPLLTELANFSRRYLSVSTILEAEKGVLTAVASSLFARMQEHFRREERELLVEYDRATAAAGYLGA